MIADINLVEKLKDRIFCLLDGYLGGSYSFKQSTLSMMLNIPFVHSAQNVLAALNDEIGSLHLDTKLRIRNHYSYLEDVFNLKIEAAHLQVNPDDRFIS